jgi:NADPH-dependent 2,4-dienoyl-CoA reductase/sulfur reductase-like enzyme
VTTPRSIVIVGAGLAGAKAAETLREEGYDGRLVLVGDEPERPYERPPLSKDYLRGESGREAVYVHEPGFYGERAIDCAAVVVGVGVVPRTALAEAAGLAVGDGVLVDANLRASAPGVYAAGDVASAMHPFYGWRVRVEHWANALNQGPAAARNMLGADEPYDRIPYFFSDQYEVGMEYSGLARGSDQVVLRGDLAARELIAFWIADGRVAAGMNVNLWDVTEPIQALIRSRAPVDPDRLRDPAVPLEELAAVAAGSGGGPRP